MNKKWVITIGREFCSGGAEIASKVAERLGYKYLDKSIIDETADILQISREQVEYHDEKSDNGWNIPNYWYNNYMADPSLVMTEGMKIAEAQFEVIKKNAADGNCVIVGRCADKVLRKDANVMTVFIHADLNLRVVRAMKLYGITENEARKLIKKTDKVRSQYYGNYTCKKWGDADNYNLYLDSGELGINKTVDAIIAHLKVLDE